MNEQDPEILRSKLKVGEWGIRITSLEKMV